MQPQTNFSKTMISQPAFCIFGDFTHFLYSQPNAQKNNVSGYGILGGPNKNIKSGFYSIRQEIIIIKSIWLRIQSTGCEAAATPPNLNFNKIQICRHDIKRFA
jgi:hypothetical protein